MMDWISHLCNPMAQLCADDFIQYTGMFAEKNWPTAIGRPGSAVVQIVDSGSWATFDCHMTVFNKITDYNTGHHTFLKYVALRCVLFFLVGLAPLGGGAFILWVEWVSVNQHNFCPDDSFRAGFFPVSYEEVPCDTSSQGPVVGVLQYDPWSKRQEFSVYLSASG